MNVEIKNGRIEGKVSWHGTEYVIKQKYNKFKFACGKCGKCCSDIDIMLDPYDIVRICNRLKITSGEFFQKYAEVTLGADSRIPIALLKTRPRCVFNNKTCSIYEDRPTNCRAYPVGRITQMDKTTGKDVVGYIINPHCSSIQSNKKHTIEEWLKEEGVEIYYEMSKRWNKFITDLLHKGFAKDNEMFNFLFIRICYDFDNELYKNLMEAKGIKEFRTAEEKFNFIMDNAEFAILNMASKVDFKKIKEEF